MKIKEILSQNRRDFTAIFECEHCGDTEKKGGYDDQYFHETGIPLMVCKECGKTAPDNFKPMAPKYAAHEVV